MSSLPGSVTCASKTRDSASSPVGMTVNAIVGATLGTVTDDSLVFVSSPSLTSSNAVPVQSSPHVYVATGSGEYAVSQMPSPSKSHRYVRASPSGSVEADASKTTMPPSSWGPFRPKLASGGRLLFGLVVAYHRSPVGSGYPVSAYAKWGSPTESIAREIWSPLFICLSISE